MKPAGNPAASRRQLFPVVLQRQQLADSLARYMTMPALYAASHETAEAKEVWNFLPDGPFKDLATFKAWVGP